jgi:drug/metabolite transporter (DMT)-like permease
MTGRSQPARWLVDLALVLVALIWGATFVLVKEALANVSTLLFLTLRFTAATVALVVIFWVRGFGGQGRPAFVRESIGPGILAGICLFSGYVFQTLGLKYTSAPKAAFITGLCIPLVPLFSAIVYKRIPQTSEVLGVLAAFAGMSLMTVQRDLLEVGAGDLLVLCCTVAYAFHILVLGHFANRTNVRVMSVVQIATGAVMGASTFWWMETPRIVWTASVWTALVVTSLLATALAFSVQTWAQQHGSPTRTALIFALEPVFAWCTSWLLAGETLNGRGIAGAALILAGILLVELKPFGVREHQST